MLHVPSLFCTLAAVLAPQDTEDRGLRRYGEGAFDGYTLIAPLQSDHVYLVDMEGELVHEWVVDQGGDGGNYLLENGDLLRSGLQPDNPRFNGGGIGGRIQRYDWNGERVWLYLLSDDQRSHHHDVELLPNGNVLAIAWEYRSREELIAHGRDPEHVGDQGLWPDHVVEIRPTLPEGGEIVWEWHAFDHLVQDFDEEKANFGSPFDHPERIDVNVDHRDQPPKSAEQMAADKALREQMRALGYLADGGEESDEGAAKPGGGARQNTDWFHTNAIAYHPGEDLIVLSTPRLNELWVIDHSTTPEEARGSTGGRHGHGGDLLYRFGNPKNYGHGTADDQFLRFQHNPTWLETGSDDELRLLVFNNQGGLPDAQGRRNSMVAELLLPFEAGRGFVREEFTPFGPEAPEWSYEADSDHSSGFISGAQRLPNGNTLICAGAPGRIYEVTPQGEIVWDYLNPYGGENQEGRRGGAPPKAVFRAQRFGYDDPRFEGRL